MRPSGIARVVNELIPETLTLGDVQKVLQNLLRERVSVKDIITILEALADYRAATKDTDILRVRPPAVEPCHLQAVHCDDGKLTVFTLIPT